MSSCNAPSPSAPSSCTRSAPSQASGLRPSASEPGRTPMQESRDRASSDGRAPLVASLLESARTKGRKMLCASPDHQLVHVQAAVCGPQNRQYQTSGTTCRIRVQERGAPGRGGANLGRRPRVQKEADVAPSPPAADPGPDTPGVTDRPGARATTLHCPDLPMPIATLAAALQSGQTLNDQPLLAIATLFGAGVLTSLTPCIYPMIPITAGLIASTARAQGEEPSRLRVVGLTLTYVSGLALLYALLGLIAGLSGQVFGTVSSSPWALFAIACLLVVFGLAMLDVIPVNAPRRLAR